MSLVQKSPQPGKQRNGGKQKSSFLFDVRDIDCLPDRNNSLRIAIFLNKTLSIDKLFIDKFDIASSFRVFDISQLSSTPRVVLLARFNVRLCISSTNTIQNQFNY